MRQGNNTRQNHFVICLRVILQCNYENVFEVKLFISVRMTCLLKFSNWILHLLRSYIRHGTNISDNSNFSVNSIKNDKMHTEKKTVMTLYIQSIFYLNCGNWKCRITLLNFKKNFNFSQLFIFLIALHIPIAFNLFSDNTIESVSVCYWIVCDCCWDLKIDQMWNCKCV